MTSFLDKLNLRPQERRLVVIVGIVVFVVLNLLLVWPHFGDLGRQRQRKDDAEKNLRRYKEELGKEAEYKRELDRLQSLGNYVASDQQALDLMREVQAQAAACGVGVQRWDHRTTSARTNSFFDEVSLTITINTAEKELVDFLWNLSGQGSLTRVRTMSLRRDPSQMKLAGDLTLIKSYQRKPAKPAAAVKTAAAKPATNAPPKVLAAAKPGANASSKTVVPPTARPGTNAPPKVLPGSAKPAAKPKPGGSSTNAVHSTVKGKANNSSTNAPTFLKRIFSKWF